MNKIGKYVANQVLTASPAELILMLFNEGIRSLNKTEDAFALETPERIAVIHNHLMHAQDVVRELSYSLDMEKGGDLAKNLGQLYDFLLRHLIQANIDKKLQPVVEVREMLITLRDAWQHVVEKDQESKDTTPRQDVPNNRILAAG